MGSIVSEKDDIKVKNVSSYEKIQSYFIDWLDDEFNNFFFFMDVNGDLNLFDDDVILGMEV